MPLVDGTYGLNESDALRIPTSSGYVEYPLVELLGFSGGMLRSTANFGLPPIRFITTRGPFQDGETPLDMRLDPRVIQIEVVEYLANRTEFWTRRNELLDLIRPNRSFDATATAATPMVYRKRLPGGKPERGSDGVSDGAGEFTSNYGRFVHYGGLQAGDRFQVSGTDYVITSVVNDYTVTLTPAPGAATNLPWRYWRNRSVRDAYVLLEQGPTFNEQVGSYRAPEGYREALRLVAHDPIWYGSRQSQTWAIDEALGDLVFDGYGAWFGTTAGTGRWLFSTTYVGQTASVIYWGTWPAKPTIVISGPATNPTIINSTIDVQLNMDYSVALGETVTINTLNLTVTNNSGDNLLPYLTGDLATFELSPEPQAPARVNSVYVSFSDGVVGQSAAILYWKNGYIGV